MFRGQTDRPTERQTDRQTALDIKASNRSLKTKAQQNLKLSLFKMTARSTVSACFVSIPWLKPFYLDNKTIKTGFNYCYGMEVASPCCKMTGTTGGADRKTT